MTPPVAKAHGRPRHGQITEDRPRSRSFTTISAPHFTFNHTAAGKRWMYGRASLQNRQDPQAVSALDQGGHSKSTTTTGNQDLLCYQADHSLDRRGNRTQDEFRVQLSVHGSVATQALHVDIKRPTAFHLLVLICHALIYGSQMAALENVRARLHFSHHVRTRFAQLAHGVRGGCRRSRA